MKRYLAVILSLLTLLGSLSGVGIAEAEAPAEAVAAEEAPVVEEAPQEAPAEEAPAEVPDEEAAEAPAEPGEAPAEESPEESPAENVPAEEEPAADEPAEEPVDEQPAEEPAEEPVEEPSEEPAEEPVEEPAEEPIEEEPVEEPVEEAPAADEAEEISDEEAAAAADFTVSNGVITAYSGIGGDVIIPASLGVTSIGANVFKGNSAIQSITIPYGVTSIGNYAFNNCSGLTKVSFPSTLTTIGEHSFEGDKGLQTITFPSSLASIGHSCFEKCTGLRSITFSGSSLASIATDGFAYCSALTEVSLPSSLTTLGSYAFYNCTGLRTITISGSGLRTVGAYAFYGCSALNSISLPNSVTSIGEFAFRYCSNLATANLGTGLTSMGTDCLRDSGLTQITIPGSLATLPNYTFKGCGELETVVLSSGVTSIGQYAFVNCVKLQSITFPASVTSIGYDAFEGCTSLSTVSFSGSGLKSIAGYAFKNCSALKKITLPNSVNTIGDCAFRNCTGMTSLTLGTGLTSIGNDCFRNTGIVSLTIPGNLPSISNYAFCDCTSLESLTLSSGVVSIKEYTFKDCTALKSVNLSHTLTSIGYYAFAGCISLTQVVIPDSVTTISNYAFNKCSSLTSILIPESVTTFGGSSIFSSCPSLTARVYEGSFAEEYCRNNNVPYTIISVSNPSITSAIVVSQTVLSSGKAEITFRVKTNTDANNVHMYIESGSEVAVFTSANASYSDSGSVRTWTIVYSLDNDGPRQLSFKASENGSKLSSAVSTSFTAYAATVQSASISPSSIDTGATATITVKTSYGASYLTMYAENGSAVKTWDVSSVSTSVSGSTRTWKVTYAFATAGNRTLTFKVARVSGSPTTSKKTATVTVNSASASVTSVAFGSDSVEKGVAVSITAKTSSSAMYLRMYSESGSAVKTWTASGNSTVSGSTRTWNLTYSFASTGDRVLSFRASVDGSTYGTGKKASITVTASLPAVTSAAFTVSSVAQGAAAGITVKTPSTAKYLRMYAENGSAVKTWTASGNSTVSGSTRTWNLTYSFASTGDRVLSFRASADGTNYGTGKKAGITVTSPAPAVTSASKNLTDLVARKDFVTITAKTPSSAQYLHLCVGSSSVKRWAASGNSTVSGTTRTWTVKYQFANGGGSRSVIIRASEDGSTMGAGKTLTFNVTSAIALTKGQTLTCTISTSGQYAYYYFSPSTSGTYTFYSTGSADTQATLYRSLNNTEIKSDDDSGDGTNFKISQSLTAGYTYVLAVRLYDNDTGSFTVGVK